MASNKYEEIAQAAVKLFEQKGYHATSVQDIADEVGLQKGSLYHYISSKEDLLAQLTHRSITDFNNRLERIMDSAEMSFKERLHRAIETHLQAVTQNMQLSTVLLRESFSLGEEQGKIITGLTDRHLNLWTQLIEQGIAAGEFREVNPRVTALAILGSVNWAYRWYQEGGKMSSSDISGLFADLFLDGVREK